MNPFVDFSAYHCQNETRSSGRWHPTTDSVSASMTRLHHDEPTTQRAASSFGTAIKTSGGPRPKPNNSTQTQPKKKAVRFFHSTSVFLIPTYREMSDEEHCLTWYDEAEQEELMADNVRCIREGRRREKRIRSNKDQLPPQEEHKRCNNSRPQHEHDDDILPQDEEEDNDELCTRGLEPMLSPQALARCKASKSNAINAVLNEQHIQRNLLLCDSNDAAPAEDALREASLSVSKPCVMRALATAAQDALFVKRETLKTLRSLRGTGAAAARHSGTASGMMSP